MSIRAFLLVFLVAMILLSAALRSVIRAYPHASARWTTGVLEGLLILLSVLFMSAVLNTHL